MRLLCDGMESSSSSSTFQLWIFLSDGCVQNKVLRSDFCILTGQNGTKLRIFFFLISPSLLGMLQRELFNYAADNKSPWKKWLPQALCSVGARIKHGPDCRRSSSCSQAPEQEISARISPLPGAASTAMLQAWSLPWLMSGRGR